MSGTTLRALVAAVLFIHGIGHATGIIPALQLFEVKNWNSRSWLLTPILGETVSRILSIILFLIALIGFIGSTLALLDWVIPHDWWRMLALVSSVISIVTIVLFWNAFVTFFPNKVGAFGVDIAVLVCLLILNWPTEAALGY
ncbi:MAG: hypothetical protein PVH95_06445 [Anaerolineae bacterium]|jgi:hypothetical protein